MVSDGDYHCCGFFPPLEEAVEAGFDSTCQWAHASLAEAMDEHPEIPHRHVIVEDSYQHVVTMSEGPVQDQLETWVQSVLE